MKSPTQILRGAVVAAVSILALAAPAQADILLEFDRLISGVEGSVRTIGDVGVDPDLVGQTCQVSVIGKNQASVHPGNDLIVSTGGSSAVVVGVEDEVDAGINHTSQLVLGPSIVVQLRFGPDELSSLGFSLSFDCTQPVTTTAAPTSTVAPAPTCDDASAGAAVTGGATDGPTEAVTDGSGCAPVSCTDDGSVVATTVTTSGDGSAPVAADGSGCAPVSCTDDGSVVATTTLADAASATVCPDPPSSQASTTTAPPATTPPTTAVSTTTTVVSSGSATAVLPVSPVATAIAAAPAYAG